ncbi:GAP family protein [Streptomyces sp. NPDC015032]|uniref:GAP family protein n=1 Tax=Streptomyces sp. NPDC015032 TaxID=3364937 RepID=UPI0036F50556
MGAVIGELLPLAVGVAISPLPIIAVNSTLLSRNAAKTSTGLLTGWVAGIVGVVVVVALLVGQAPDTSAGEPSTVSSVLKLVFGLLMLVLAAQQWRERPKPGQTAVMPKWMSSIDSFGFGKALGLGLAVSAANPANLVLLLSAGTTIGAAHLSSGGDVMVVVVFTLIAASTVTLPVIGCLAARDRMAQPLESLRGWLGQNSATLMAVLLLVIGVVLLGEGIGELSS